MDGASLAVAVIGLSSLFSTAMECFEYVQLGKSFGSDFGKCLLRLDDVKLRLSRWGTSVGLGRHPAQGQPQVIPQNEFEYARCLCEQIVACFEEAEGISNRYKKYAATDPSRSSTLVVYNATEMEAQPYQLHQTMRDLAIGRQKETSVLKKTKWALYDRSKFNSLIDEVSEFVNILIERFPAAHSQQEALVVEEIRAVQDPIRLRLLEEAIGNDDLLLRDAARQALQTGNTATDWEVGGKSTFRLGNNIQHGSKPKNESNSASRFKVMGGANVRIGNDYEGKR